MKPTGTLGKHLTNRVHTIQSSTEPQMYVWLVWNWSTLDFLKDQNNECEGGKTQYLTTYFQYLKSH